MNLRCLSFHSESPENRAWNAANGIVNSVELPALVEDARSRAFVDRAGWRSEAGFTISTAEESNHAEVVHYLPAGGSEVEVTSDFTDHLVRQVVVQTEDGPLTITYRDWHRVGKVSFPFRKVETSSTGETTTFEVKRVRVLSKLPPDTLARSARSPHGRLVSVEGARISFRYAGSHILVSALVNGVPADVVFDTGAANYFSPLWSEQFGLKVSGGLKLSGVGESSTAGGYALAKKISLGSAELSDESRIGPGRSLQLFRNFAQSAAYCFCRRRENRGGTTVAPVGETTSDGGAGSGTRN